MNKWENEWKKEENNHLKDNGRISISSLDRPICDFFLLETETVLVYFILFKLAASFRVLNWIK